MRVLTRRQLNRALLARQLLLERSRSPLPRVVERVGCLQTQYAPSAYIGLWTRVEGFARDDLTRALERRSLIQAMLMRNTIHVVSRRDYWPLAIAIRGERKAWSRRVQRADDRELERAAQGLRRFLADGPRKQAEIAASGFWRPGIAVWVDVVRVPPSGNPQSERTFLVDGKVAGTWRYERGRVRLDTFGRLTRDARRELAEEGERLAAFHA